MRNTRSVRLFRFAGRDVFHRDLSVYWLLLIFALVVVRGVAQDPAPTPRLNPGPQPDGSVLLPTGWSISPAGKQIPLSTLPMSAVISPDGRYVLTLNGGVLPPTVSVIDLSTETETVRVPVKDAWHGLVFNKAGDRIYVGGGSALSVFEFAFEQGKLALRREFPVMAADRRRPSDHIGDVLLGPQGRFLYIANVTRNSITVMNALTGFVVNEFATGRRPYRLLLGPDGKTLLVSHWAEASVGVYDLGDGRLIERIAVGPHPTDMAAQPWNKEPDGEDRPVFTSRLFVACANSNAVWVLGRTAGGAYTALETIRVGPTPNSPFGSLPTALALRADGQWLYTANSGNNAIVVADVSEERAELLGAIPTGWFPTAVIAAPDGRLVYLNGKGAGSGSDPPDATEGALRGAPPVQAGSLGILPPLNEELIAQLTDKVIANTPYDDSLMISADVPEESPIPSTAEGDSPIRHVLYVVKESGAYDQLLGDFESGEGDPALVVFPEEVAPNHRKLAREFTLLDNYYAAGSIDADGQNWAFAATANDYVEKMWPSYAAGRRGVYDFEGGEAAAVPSAGYLWNNARAARVSLRNYGVWASSGGPDGAFTAGDPSLLADTNQQFAPADAGATDNTRVDEFIRELEEFSATGTMPQLVLIRLANVPAPGVAPGEPVARAMMAEHDYAVGRLVEAVTNSPFWPHAAIFIVDDDAQAEGDHIGSHRAPAFVVSPFARRGFVDSSFYSTPSVLRTIELLLGLRPMTQFDAGAPVLWPAFASDPDVAPYEAVRPKQP